MWTCNYCGATPIDDAKEFCFECMTTRETKIKLVSCPVCNNLCSLEAVSCPKCGHPLANNKTFFNENPNFIKGVFSSLRNQSNKLGNRKALTIIIGIFVICLTTFTIYKFLSS